jgi:hypothetical protein
LFLLATLLPTGAALFEHLYRGGSGLGRDLHTAEHSRDLFPALGPIERRYQAQGAALLDLLVDAEVSLGKQTTSLKLRRGSYMHFVNRYQAIRRAAERRSSGLRNDTLNEAAAGGASTGCGYGDFDSISAGRDRGLEGW